MWRETHPSLVVRGLGPSIRSYGCRCLSSDGYSHEHHRHASFRKRLEFRLEIEVDSCIDSKSRSRSNIDSKSARLDIVTCRLDSPDASTRISTRRLVTWRPDITSAQHFLGAARPHGSNTTRPGLQASDDHLHAGTAPTAQHAKPSPLFSRRRPRRSGQHTTSSPYFRAIRDKQSCASGGVAAPRVRSHGIPLRTAVQSRCSSTSQSCRNPKGGQSKRPHAIRPAVRAATNEAHTASAAAILQ